jgi:hypothetical protein
MTSPDTLIDRLDWAGIGAQLDAEGCCLLPGLLGAEAARRLARRMPVAADGEGASRRGADPGNAEVFYFDSALPAPLDAWRTAFYGHLAAIANRWNDTLGMDDRYPATLGDFLRRNRKAGQTRGQSYLSRLGVEDHVPLHQRNAGEEVFPLQLVALLSEPGTDFQGGEFVMTEQRPRMQSRPMVLPLGLGDAALIATAQRPFKGSKGHYRVNLKHAIGRVRQGERIGLELSFHDAA